MRCPKMDQPTKGRLQCFIPYVDSTKIGRFCLQSVRSERLPQQLDLGHGNVSFVFIDLQIYLGSFNLTVWNDSLQRALPAMQGSTRKIRPEAN